MRVTFETSTDLKQKELEIKQQMLAEGASQEFLDTLTINRCCDVCQITIPTDYIEGIRECEKCFLKFDVCKSCQEYENEYQTVCPPNFGCTLKRRALCSNEASDSTNEAQSNDTYSLGGEQFSSGAKNVENKEDVLPQLVKDICETRYYMIGGLQTDEAHLDWQCLADLWLYFRSTEDSVLEKYGPPSTPVVALRSPLAMSLFRKLLPMFRDFLALDTEEMANQPLMMTFVYPNGDEFLIKRLYGEEKEKQKMSFVIAFIGLSGLQGWPSRYFYGVPGLGTFFNQASGQVLCVGYCY